MPTFIFLLPYMVWMCWKTSGDEDGCKTWLQFWLRIGSACQEMSFIRGLSEGSTYLRLPIGMRDFFVLVCLGNKWWKDTWVDQLKVAQSLKHDRSTVMGFAPVTFSNPKSITSEQTTKSNLQLDMLMESQPCSMTHSHFSSNDRFFLCFTTIHYSALLRMKWDFCALHFIKLIHIIGESAATKVHFNFNKMILISLFFFTGNTNKSTIII